MAAPVGDETTRKSGRLGIRATERQRSLLVAASQAEGTTVSDFVLRHATRAAEEVLADRRVFMLSSEMWDRFDGALEQPPKDVPGLDALMRTPTILDDD